MKALFRGLLAVAAVVLVLGGSATLWFLQRSGAFRDLRPHFDGACDALPLPGSGEDIQVDAARGYAYVSQLDRQAVIRGQPAEGTIVRLDLGVQPIGAVPALVSRPSHFQPHGLSLYVGPDGVRHLLVINHPNRRGVEPEAVEHFAESAPGSFVHVETFRDPLFNSPNDLVAVGPRQFYVANDKATGGGLRAALQQAGFGASTLVYVDGDAARVVADDIASGGGINASPDRRFLYVSETAGRRLRVLERTGADGGVVERGRIPVDTAPDNIDVSPDGTLWVAGHANALALIRHFVSGSPAPSQVWRIRVDEAGALAGRDEAYLDDGTHIPAGSVGANYGNLLLVGSITAPRVMICRFSR